MAAISPLMSIMIKAAEKASRALIRDFGEVEQLQISRKGPGDFVTAADKRSEKILFEELSAARPDFSFLMEESGEVKGKDPENIWIIDPLDGTHNFMHGLPHWCISIALETKGKVLAGLVYDPAKDEMFRAEKGLGAFMNNKRLRVSGRSDFDSAMVATGNILHTKKDNGLFIKELDAITAQVPFLRRQGAAALDLAYVAAGRLDGFWERHLKPWDLAAGQLIVKEAGGLVSSIENEENVLYSKSLVAGNQGLYPDLRRILKAAA